MLTKFTDADLRREINTVLDDLQAQGGTLSPCWVTHLVCKAHATGLSEDGREGTVESVHTAFWRFGGYTITRKLATACINDRDDPMRERQDTLRFGSAPPELGLTLVNAYYVVTRDGEATGVKTEDLTIEELLAKAELYEHNASRLVAHAQQLRRYAEWRATREWVA